MVQRHPLISAFVLVVMAATLTRAAVTRDGVGPVEYTAVAAIVAVLLVCAFRLSRSAVRRA